MDRVQGALVESTYPDSPAAQAGIKAHDVILEMDGVFIRNENHLINLISTLPAGQKIKLNVWRDRKNVSVEAHVGDWAKAQAKLRNPQ
jgi:S1-C subfamily serine protease